MIFLEIVWGEESGPSSFRRYCTNENNETWDMYMGLKGELTLSKLFSSFVDYMIKIPFFFHIFWIKWWRKKKRLRQRRLENSVQFLPWRKYRKTIFAHFSCSTHSKRHTSASNVCNSWNLSNAVKFSHRHLLVLIHNLPFGGEKNVEHFNLSNCW